MDTETETEIETEEKELELDKDKDKDKDDCLEEELDKKKEKKNECNDITEHIFIYNHLNDLLDWKDKLTWIAWCSIMLFSVFCISKLAKYKPCPYPLLFLVIIFINHAHNFLYGGYLYKHYNLYDYETTAIMTLLACIYSLRYDLGFDKQL